MHACDSCLHLHRTAQVPHLRHLQVEAINMYEDSRGRVVGRLVAGGRNARETALAVELKEGTMRVVELW